MKVEELAEDIREMLEENERFKDLWVCIWTDTIHEWIRLKWRFERKARELESEYDEEKIAIRVAEWDKYFELKDMPTKITDKAVQYLIDKALKDRYEIQARRKNIANLLRDEAKNIEHYMNDSKLEIKTTSLIN